MRSSGPGNAHKGQVWTLETSGQERSGPSVRETTGKDPIRLGQVAPPLSTSFLISYLDERDIPVPEDEDELLGGTGTQFIAIRP